MKNKNVILVTGGSSGIGKETAIQLYEAGNIVYAAARRIDKMKDIEEIGIKTISLDVTTEDSMVACIQTIVNAEGRIDVLVNNAGYGSYGAIEDVPIEEARRQFDVNIFGLARLTQLVLPHMRQNHYGKIINISSMGGKIYTPLGGWYHATKHALEGFSDCLRMEVRDFGIDVVIIEPGGIKTEWGHIAADHLLQTSGTGAYSVLAQKTAENMHEMYSGKQLSNPEIIAKTIVKAVIARRPRTRYAIGYMAKPSIFMRKILSDRMFDKIVSKMV